MPLFVFGVSIAEPSAALRAVHRRRIIARFIVRRHCLAQALHFFFHRRLGLLFYASSRCCCFVRQGTHTRQMTYPKFYLTDRYVPCINSLLVLLESLFPGHSLTGYARTARWPHTWRLHASGANCFVSCSDLPEFAFSSTAHSITAATFRYCNFHDTKVSRRPRSEYHTL
jgi:hypothetical protein